MNRKEYIEMLKEDLRKSKTTHEKTTIKKYLNLVQPKNNKIKDKNLILIFVMLGIGMVGGFLMGTYYQQMIFTAGLVEFGESLEGTNIEVNIDLNETKLVEGFTKMFNETLTKNLTQNGNPKP